MEDIGKILAEVRKKNNLSIEQVSDKTKIRPNFIKAIEKGDFSVLPAIYIKSFVKTYAEFLEIPESQIAKYTAQILPSTLAPIVAEAPPAEIAKENQKKPLKSEKMVFESESNLAEKSISTAKGTNYKDVFKKKGIKQVPKISIINYSIYSIISLAVIAGVYFTFFWDSSSGKASNANLKSDTLKINSDNDNLLGYFEKKDSLKLTVNAIDTAWIRLEIDGKKVIEILMKPGMEENWSANEFFIVSHGNVGALNFSRNGEKLDPFGARRSVARNIRITKSEVTGSSPWKQDSLTRAISNESGTQKILKRPKRKEEKKPEIKIITPSIIEKPAIKKEPGKIKF